MTRTFMTDDEVIYMESLTPEDMLNIALTLSDGIAYAESLLGTSKKLEPKIWAENSSHLKRAITLLLAHSRQFIKTPNFKELTDASDAIKH